VQLRTMEANPSLAILSAGMAIVDNQNDIVGVRIVGSTQPGLTLLPRPRRPKTLPIAHAPSMILRDVAIKERFDPSLPIVEDMDYLMRLMLHHNSGVLSDILYVYTELDTISLGKMVASFRHSRRVFSKHRDIYPFAMFREYALSILKEYIYRMGFVVGLDKALIMRRSMKPSASMFESYATARSVVHGTWARHFSNNPVANRISD
ncbi:MAG: hypothetical protein KC547_06880, partial [Anaerolineae bacterium]|nr:hypothetical protein [Anaerolineae bacterium]